METPGPATLQQPYSYLITPRHLLEFLPVSSALLRTITNSKAALQLLRSPGLLRLRCPYHWGRAQTGDGE
jgi:hypothetical protein